VKDAGGVGAKRGDQRERGHSRHHQNPAASPEPPPSQSTAVATLPPRIDASIPAPWSRAGGNQPQ
jgi:hypothetical protein